MTKTKKKKLLSAVLAASAFTLGLQAASADGVRAPVYKAAPPFNWSKCYLGIHGGYGWGKNTNSFGNAIASGKTEIFEAFPAEFGPFNHHTNGGVFGSQAGCNYQLAAHWLVGIEGEFWWSGIKGSFTAPEDGTPPGDPGQFSRFESRNLWDADLALRLGFVSGPNLFYVKSGVAVGHFRYTETHDDFPTTHGCPGLAFVGGQFINGQCSVGLSNTRAGWLVGLGWETVLGPPTPSPFSFWTFKAEWDWISYGTTNIAYPSADAALQSFPVTDTKQIFKIGLNFYF